VIKFIREYYEDSDIGRGVRPGCCISPILFNIYADAIMTEAIEGIEEGIKLGGKLIQDARFADNHGMIASTEKGFKKLWTSLMQQLRTLE